MNQFCTECGKPITKILKMNVNKIECESGHVMCRCPVHKKWVKKDVKANKLSSESCICD